MAEEAPPADYSGLAGLQYAEMDDKSAVDGRRSRQTRRQDAEWSAAPGDRTPSNTDRMGAVGFGPSQVPLSSTVGKTNRTTGAAGTGGAGAAFGLAGAGVITGAEQPLPTKFQQSGAGWAAAADNTSVGGRHTHTAGTGGSRHGVSAGTGGSEEWPSNQARAMRGLREQEYEDEKAGLPRRKVGRQPAALGGVPAPQPRRSPELVDPWQAAPDNRGEAWRGGEAAPELHGHGLPTRASVLPASRLAAGTPTPREEDSLDLVPRGSLHHGHGFPGAAPRWGGGAAANDWTALGLGPSELGPVRDPRGLHDGRAVPGALGSLVRRPDLSGVYHGH